MLLGSSVGPPYYWQNIQMFYHKFLILATCLDLESGLLQSMSPCRFLNSDLAFTPAKWRGEEPAQGLDGFSWGRLQLMFRHQRSRLGLWLSLVFYNLTGKQVDLRNFFCTPILGVQLNNLISQLCFDSEAYLQINGSGNFTFWPSGLCAHPFPRQQRFAWIQCKAQNLKSDCCRVQVVLASCLTFLNHEIGSR